MDAANDETVGNNVQMQVVQEQVPEPVPERFGSTEKQRVQSREQRIVAGSEGECGRRMDWDCHVRRGSSETNALGDEQHARYEDSAAHPGDEESGKRPRERVFRQPEELTDRVEQRDGCAPGEGNGYQAEESSFRHAFKMPRLASVRSGFPCTVTGLDCNPLWADDVRRIVRACHSVSACWSSTMNPSPGRGSFDFSVMIPSSSS